MEKVCDVCGKGVKTKQALQFHLNSHNGVKKFSCQICFMSFTSRSSMASHTRRHVNFYLIQFIFVTKYLNTYAITDGREAVPVQAVHQNIYVQFCPQ